MTVGRGRAPNSLSLNELRKNYLNARRGKQRLNIFDCLVSYSTVGSAFSSCSPARMRESKELFV